MAAIVAIITVVILATTVVLLFLWDYQKRERARRVLHGSRENQTVVIRLENYNDRLEHRRVMLLGRPHVQPSVQRGRIRAGSFAYLPNGLQMPRRPEAAASASAAGTIRVAEAQAHSRVSEETSRTLVASIGEVRSVLSDRTLRDTETEDDSSEMEGETSASDNMDAGNGSSETDSETSTTRPRRVSSLGDFAGYRSWRNAE